MTMRFGLSQGRTRLANMARKRAEKIEITVELVRGQVYSALVRAKAFVTKNTAGIVRKCPQEFAP